MNNKMQLWESTIVLLQDIKKDQQTQLLFFEVPTLDFLLKKHIITRGDEWDAEDEAPGENPMQRTILFKNKMRITSAFEKLILYQDLKVKTSLNDLQQIAVKLLDKIKDGEYAGAGINFLSVMECENPAEEIKTRFLSAIPKLPIEKIVGGSFSYIYKKEDIQITVSISPVKSATEAIERKGISISANYHSGVTHIKKIQEFIRGMDSLKEDHLEQSQALFG